MEHELSVSVHLVPGQNWQLWEGLVSGDTTCGVLVIAMSFMVISWFCLACGCQEVMPLVACEVTSDGV